jgi:hypothetical protein
VRAGNKEWDDASPVTFQVPPDAMHSFQAVHNQITWCSSSTHRFAENDGQWCQRIVSLSARGNRLRPRVR